MKPSLACASISVAPDLSLYHVGPSLDHGPLPSIFYFALSGPDTLCVDPYNQPVQFLSDRMVRFFSLTLPAHENNLPPQQAIGTWAEEMGRGIDRLSPFLDAVQQCIEFAIHERFVDPHHLGVAGLSRGALIASHVAARDKRIRFILQFAPLTTLSTSKEFCSLTDDPLVRSFDAIHTAPFIYDRHTRLYIGNHDTLVSTRSCFNFCTTLVEEARKAQISTPQIEMIISPSIGHKGHGTPPEIFQQGIQWLGSSLNRG